MSDTSITVIYHATVCKARFSKKSLWSDVGEIKKISTKFKKKISVGTAKCSRKI